MNPTASVIVPTFNRAAALKKCLASLRQQSQNSFETIVVPFSGDKKTLETLSNESGITVRVSSRLGVAFQRNLGVRAAKSSKILFLDDDCIAPQDWVERMEKQLDSFDLVQGKTINHSKGFSPAFFYKASINKLGFARHEEAGGKETFPIMCTTNLGARKEAFSKAGLFDSFYCYYLEDADWVFRCYKKGLRMGWDESIVVGHFPKPNYYRNNSSLVARNESYFAAKHFGLKVFPAWMKSRLCQLVSLRREPAKSISTFLHSSNGYFRGLLKRFFK